VHRRGEPNEAGKAVPAGIPIPLPTVRRNPFIKGSTLMKKTPLVLVLSSLFLAFSAHAELKAGTYTASALGQGGPVPVTVTVEGGKIASITVGDNKETVGIGAVPEFYSDLKRN
jgi:hypothetical protein